MKWKTETGELELSDMSDDQLLKAFETCQQMQESESPAQRDAYMLYGIEAYLELKRRDIEVTITNEMKAAIAAYNRLWKV